MINDTLWLAIFRAVAPHAPDQATAGNIVNDVHTEIRRSGLKVAPLSMRSGVAKRNRDNGVPLEGDIAFASGWDTSACPHEWHTVEAYRWISDWWRAHADAFESHVHGHEGDDLGNPQG